MNGRKLRTGDRVSTGYGEGVILGGCGHGKQLKVLIDDGRIVKAWRHATHYVPRLEDIEAAKLAISSNWSAYQRWNRTSSSDRHYPLEIPGGERYGMPVEDWEIKQHYTESGDD